MSIEEFGNLIESTGIPAAYYAFPETEAPALPFITWMQTGTENFAADNIVLYEIDKMAVELYTEKRDLQSEKAVEDALLAGGFFWDKEIAYVEDEKCYQIAYIVNL